MLSKLHFSHAPSWEDRKILKGVLRKNRGAPHTPSSAQVRGCSGLLSTVWILPELVCGFPWPLGQSGHSEWQPQKQASQEHCHRPVLFQLPGQGRAGVRDLNPSARAWALPQTQDVARHSISLIAPQISMPPKALILVFPGHQESSPGTHLSSW